MARNAVGLWKDTPITFDQFIDKHPYNVEKPDGTVLYRYSNYLCAARTVAFYGFEQNDKSLVVNDGSSITDYGKCKTDVTNYRPRLITYRTN